MRQLIFYCYIFPEAVKAILTYSNTAVELLRRKKMKRGILFQYLTECDVFVQVVADKKEIMNLVLSHWGSPVADHKDSRSLRTIKRYIAKT